MNSKRVWEVALTVLVAIFLLVAAEGRHSYGFYMVLRTAATVGGIYWAVRVYQAGPRGWMWAFLAVALLLNPVLPVRMHREHWQPIDMVLGVLLFGWACAVSRRERSDPWATAFLRGSSVEATQRAAGRRRYRSEAAAQDNQTASVP